MNGMLTDATAEGAMPENSHLRRCLRDLFPNTVKIFSD